MSLCIRMEYVGKKRREEGKDGTAVVDDSPVEMVLILS